MASKSRAKPPSPFCGFNSAPEVIRTAVMLYIRYPLGNLDRRECGRWFNNRAENSHLPFRRREWAMLRFRRMKFVQKFASVHANIRNHFNFERHLVSRKVYKARRAVVLAEWQKLAA